jgi:hypothetical protein
MTKRAKAWLGAGFVILMGVVAFAAWYTPSDAVTLSKSDPGLVRLYNL